MSDSNDNNVYNAIEVIRNAGTNPDGPDGVVDSSGDYVKFDQNRRRTSISRNQQW